MMLLLFNFPGKHTFIALSYWIPSRKQFAAPFQTMRRDFGLHENVLSKIWWHYLQRRTSRMRAKLKITAGYYINHCYHIFPSKCQKFVICVNVKQKSLFYMYSSLFYKIVTQTDHSVKVDISLPHSKPFHLSHLVWSVILLQAKSKPMKIKRRNAKNRNTMYSRPSVGFVFLLI